jgi:hypothetical protein
VSDINRLNKDLRFIKKLINNKGNKQWVIDKKKQLMNLQIISQ